MAERKALSKKIRFEVFKRDSFTCQYCGQSAPDVILEVDHITPVAKGGTNDILNLVTSCRDCNRGKKDRELSDASVVQKQKKQADEIQARRELIEMMCNWKNELLEEKEKELELLEKLLQAYYPNASLSAFGRKNLKEKLHNFGFSEVYESLEIALNRYKTCEQALDKVGGICYNRKINRTADFYRKDSK